MRIDKIRIQGFGGLKDRELTLDPGITVIYGENESGKTTLYHMIRAMLFGIRRMRGRASRMDVYSRYEPWENPGDFGGILWFTCGQRQFRLTRRFHREREAAELICETDGERLQAEAGDLQMLLGGVSESIFDNTVSIGQMKVQAGQELAAELQNYMAGFQESGDGELDVENVLRSLKKQRKQQEECLQEKRRAREKQLRRLAEERQRVLHRLEEKEEQQAAQESALGERRSIRAENPSLESPSGEIGKIIGAICLALAVLGAAFLEGWPKLVLLAVLLVSLGAMAVLRIRRAGREAEKRRESAQAETAEVRERERLAFLAEHLREEISELKRERENLEGEIRELEEADSEEAGIAERVQALTLSLETIQRLSGQLQRRIGGQLRERTSEIYRELTGGRYQWVNLDEALQPGADSGERVVPLHQLSRGAVEQLYFALRMAAGELLCQEEELPVILDDVFVMYDEKRLARTLQWLAGSGQQVLLCTCHKREEELLEKWGIPHGRIVL